MIEKTFRSTFEEWQEGQTLWCPLAASKLPFTQAQKIVSFGFYILAGITVARPPYWTGAVLIVLLWTTNYLVKKRRAVAKTLAFASDPDRDVDAHFIVDEAGYRSERSGLTRCEMSWQAFSGWKEGELTIILGRQSRYCFIPKRLLNEEELAQLRRLCNQNNR